MHLNRTRHHSPRKGTERKKTPGQADATRETAPPVRWRNRLRIEDSTGVAPDPGTRDAEAMRLFWPGAGAPRVAFVSHLVRMVRASRPARRRCIDNGCRQLRSCAAHRLVHIGSGQPTLLFLLLSCLALQFLLFSDLVVIRSGHMSSGNWEAKDEPREQSRARGREDAAGSAERMRPCPTVLASAEGSLTIYAISLLQKRDNQAVECLPRLGPEWMDSREQTAAARGHDLTLDG